MTTHTAPAATLCSCLLLLNGGNIDPATCPVAAHRYAAAVSAENAERAEVRAATSRSYAQRVYSAERAAHMRHNERNSLTWAADATCTA